MNKIFLTSSVSFVADSIANKLDLKGRKLKTVFITTPIEVEEGSLQWVEDDRNALNKAGFQTFDYTITGKTVDQIRTDLADIDVMYCSGGNTFYFLKKSQESGFIELVRELILEKNKIYIGTSAGSVIAGPDIYPSYYIVKAEKAKNLKDYKGFGLVDFVVLPHWGSDWFRDLYLNHRLEHAYTDKYKLILLNDYQYIEVDTDYRYRIIDVRFDINNSSR